MKTYKFSRTEEPIYYDKLKNGFTVCVLPTKEKDNYYAVLGVKYGAMDTVFIPFGKDEYYESNYGIAHYLEHQAFEMPNGEDPMAFFSQSGVNSNASTSFISTKYYIWGVKELRKNLDYLLNFVLSPYFTKENVHQELGIINEEIRMYEDDPNWILDGIVRKMVYNELPVREKIAGSYETVAKITEEELKLCYDTFYVPNNMFLIVSGNVDENEVFDLVHKHEILNKLKPNYDIKRKEYRETEKVNDEYQEVKMNICIPKVKYIFKFTRDQFSIKEDFKLDMYFNIFVAILFGSTSEFYEKIRSENIVNAYYVDHCFYSNCYTLEFSADSDRADVFKDLVDDYIKNIQISENDFERMKRVWIASEIRMSDCPDIEAENVLDDLITYNKIYPNRIDLIDKMNMKELNQLIKDLNFENSCFVLMNPKD